MNYIEKCDKLLGKTKKKVILMMKGWEDEKRSS